ncbi:MAG TPA: 3-oxoacyl-[acyl-carrier-protein] synthase III C-terminal domain-containing protein [Vicinamibacterales bacterium]|nr:3-oxoacyl-[acyl-carrier-protein] synthase III C-terminal domain-containing protein [Vicinamibacterales bacterium]
MTVHVAGIATAVPACILPQANARAFARGFFADSFDDIDRLLAAFDHTGIERRYLARPLEWYREPRSFPEKNAVYREAALELGERASRGALTSAGVKPGDIGALLFVSTTGLSTPSLDSHLIQRLGLPATTVRLPVWGLGCAGGAAGLARAANLAVALGAPVLLVAVEICSSTFVHSDRSKANLIATALFGDGAAAVVVTPGSGGAEVLSGHSHLVEASEDVMGWTLADEGLQVVFSRDIPQIVRGLAGDVAAAAARRAGVQPADVSRFIFHPGGAKVLAAYRETFGLTTDGLRHAASVLADYGNMSSPSVLFVLERFLAAEPRSGEPALLLALGPGFSAESVVLRW